MKDVFGTTPRGRRWSLVAVIAVMLMTLGVLWWDAQRSAPPAHDLIFGGDVMLGRDVERWTEAGANPLGGIAPLLESAGGVIVNLESPLTEASSPADKSIVLRASPDQVRHLSGAGVTAVTLANNHTFDYGLEGFRETIRVLDEAGISHTGAGENEDEATRPILMDLDGLSVAVVAFSKYSGEATPAASGEGFGQASYLVSDLEAAVTRASEQADLVVVALHFGREYFFEPVREQREVAYRAVDAGADVVIGHHPHVTQPVEIYDGVPIFYSLGNLVFDQETPPRDRSFLVALDVEADALSFTLYPYTITRGEVELMDKEAGTAFLHDLLGRSSEGAFVVSPEGPAKGQVGN